MGEFRRVTLCLPVEIWSEDPDGDVGELREAAGVVREAVTAYVSSAIGIDIAATGKAVVREGWDELELHPGMASHDGYAPHSHEVRPDHLGVAREG